MMTIVKQAGEREVEDTVQHMLEGFKLCPRVPVYNWHTFFLFVDHTDTGSATSGKAGGLKKVEPLKADRSCEPLKAVRL